MIEGKELLEFAVEMIKVLNEKAEKYEGNFETTTIGILREKMQDQIYKIDGIISEHIDWNKEEVKRRLVHIANFAFLLSYKIDRYDM